MRLDALARVLQDVSDDDARDAGFGDLTWVVRRTVVRIEVAPVYLESLDLSTWCSGVGPAWAERRIRVVGSEGAFVDAASVWVHVDPVSLRPSRVPASFSEVFAASAGGRAVSARELLRCPVPSVGAPGVSLHHWPLRFRDFDVLGHVNNAAYWEPVEEQLATRRSLRAPFTAVLEHGPAVERGDTVEVVVNDDGVGLGVWLVTGESVAVATVRIDPTVAELRSDRVGDGGGHG